MFKQINFGQCRIITRRLCHITCLRKWHNLPPKTSYVAILKRRSIIKQAWCQFPMKVMGSEWGKPASDRTFKCLGQPGSKGRALLFLVSKQNLDPSSWHIWHTNNGWKWIRNQKVMAPQSKGVKNSKKNKQLKTTKAGSRTPKKFLVCCFVLITDQRLFVKFHVALL